MQIVLPEILMGMGQPADFEMEVCALQKAMPNRRTLPNKRQTFYSEETARTLKNSSSTCSGTTTNVNLFRTSHSWSHSAALESVFALRYVSLLTATSPSDSKEDA